MHSKSRVQINSQTKWPRAHCVRSSLAAIFSVKEASACAFEAAAQTMLLPFVFFFKRVPLLSSLVCQAGVCQTFQCVGAFFFIMLF